MGGQGLRSVILKNDSLYVNLTFKDRQRFFLDFFLAFDGLKKEGHAESRSLIEPTKFGRLTVWGRAPKLLPFLRSGIPPVSFEIFSLRFGKDH